jgi:uncharacterized protein
LRAPDFWLHSEFASALPATTERIMEQRSSLITLGVADLERSQEFYERLGWRRSMAQAEGVVFFQTGGMALALYPRRDLTKDANIADDGRGFSGLSLAYNARTP